jgi:predicted transcriptional regulator
MNKSMTLYLEIGFASREQMKDRTIAIAKGLYKPASDEPKVWFSSLEQLYAVFSQQNMLLLEMLRTVPDMPLEALARHFKSDEKRITEQLHVLGRLGFVDIREDEEGTIEGYKSKHYERVEANVKIGHSNMKWELGIGLAA